MKSLKKSCSKKFTRRGTNQEAKELFSLIDLTGKLLREKFNDDDDDAEARYGSSERKYSVQLRLHQIREKTGPDVRVRGPIGIQGWTGENLEEPYPLRTLKRGWVLETKLDFRQTKSSRQMSSV